MNIKQKKISGRITPAFLYRFLTVLIILVIAVLLPGTDTAELPKEQTAPAPPAISPLASVLEAGEITMITFNNAVCYYEYRDRPMGFVYDLAKAFADYLGVQLKVQIIRRWDEIQPLLASTPGAIVATDVPAMPACQNDLLFSGPYLTVQPRIVVHRDNTTIRTARDLAGQSVHLSRRTDCHNALTVLQAEGISFEMILQDMDPSILIEQVSLGDIPVTVVWDHIAALNRRYYPRTAVREAVGSPAKLAWAVHPRAGRLRERINEFFSTIQQGGQFQQIYDRYFGDGEILTEIDLSAFHRRLEESLPPYRDLIRQHAGTAGLDWRLIAAQIYQESHFNPEARSRDGALGLMQILPPTGQSLNAGNLFDPARNIEAGIRHLKSLYDLFDQAEETERIAIALAAYNAGQGHILDARDLARKQGLDPDRWESLSRTLPLLSREEYYTDSLYGYCRGREPVEYVRKIMVYYDILKRKNLP